MRLIVGMTGATGAPLGVELLQALRAIPDVETHLVMSKWAKTTIELETPYTPAEVAALADYCHSPADQAATISSGSFRTDGMIIIPCSMKTLAGVRAGYAEGLVGRAADVVLKEGRKLVLVPREMPLSTIHLENMLALSRMGVAIVPPMPAFYNLPQTVDDIIQHIVAARSRPVWSGAYARASLARTATGSKFFTGEWIMAFDDLRSFLHALDQQGQLLKISEEVNAEPDLAAAANATGRIGDGAPALWFDNIRGFTDARVAMNTIGSWQNHAISLGLPPNTPVKKQIDEFIRRWDNFPVAPERRANPGWAENTVDGDAINLFDILPLFRLNDGDGGFYLDKACVVSRDPLDPDNFGKQNVGIYRMEVKGKRKLGLQPVPMHDIALHLHKAEERGEDLPIAITLGNDPIITLMGATPLKYDQSEYEMAGALRESPYPIATAPLTGFDVPWGSEVILEGVIESRKREIEGPFGEFTGHYSGGRNMTVVRIDKVSYRSKPIFESLYLGMPWTEIDYLMGPATCVPLYQQLKAEFPEVQAVNAMYTHGLLAIISTKKRYGGFARAVGLRAMTTPHGLGYVKMVIMVDEDVDPFNLPQVMWALSSKVNPAGDLVQLPNMSVLELDPGSSPAGITDKLIIDATTPVAPDNRGHYSQPVVDLPETKAWAEKLTAMLANRK